MFAVRLAFIDYAFTVGLALPVLWRCFGSNCVVRLSGLLLLAWLYLFCVVGLAVFALSLAWLSLLWRWPGYVFGVALVWLCLWCGVGLSRLPLLAWLRVSHGCRWLYIYPPDNIAYICLLCCIRHRTELLTEHCKCRETLEPENKGL